MYSGNANTNDTVLMCVRKWEHNFTWLSVYVIIRNELQSLLVLRFCKNVLKQVQYYVF